MKQSLVELRDALQLNLKSKWTKQLRYAA